MTLRDEIGVNETIVWQGKKDKRVSVFEAIFNPLLIFALVWFIFDMRFISSFLSYGGSFGTEAKSMLVFFIIHLAPVWIYIAGVLTAGLKATHTDYLITDRGIYLKSGIFTTTTEMKPFTDLSHVSVRQGIFDKLFRTGDVITTCSHISTTSSHSENGHFHGMNIENIADYEKIFRLVKEYQEAIYSDTMYPNDLRPSENHGYRTTYMR